MDEVGLIAGAELIAGNSDCHGQFDPRENPFFDADVLISKLLVDWPAEPFAVDDGE